MQRINLHRTTISGGCFQKAARLLFFTGVLLASGLIPAHGQSALDGFDPNANGTVNVVVVQPDGKILIGGNFTTLSPNGGVSVTRNRIARLNPDGTLDITFNPNASGSVNAIALQADGQILAGGFFTSIGGELRNHLARLDAITGLADTLFDPNVSGAEFPYVGAIGVQADGKILIGGDFTTLSPNGGVVVTRNRIARLETDGTLDAAFDPNANGTLWSIAVQADGKILAGGVFNGTNSIGGQTRNFIARLDATTGAADMSFDPNANNVVTAIAIQADGKILVGGGFTTIGGQTRNRIARLGAANGSADSFNPNASHIVYAIAAQPDGKILAGGDFKDANGIGGQTRNRIARLDATTGAADLTFDPAGNVGVYAIAVQADGKILAGGDFTTLAPNGGAVVTRNRLARLETDGRLDQTLDLSAVGTQLFATAVQPDGKILIGGAFNTILGVARNNIARLNTDGTLDTAFNPNANGTVFAIALQEDGKILAGGAFTGVNSIGGQMRNRIARLDATTGAADVTFDPNANDYVFSIAVQPDGKILVGGAFNGIGGPARNGFARLNAAGSADSFNPGPNGWIYTIAVQTDGKILAGGVFTSIAGTNRNRIARLDATGAADSFNPNASNAVNAIVVQADGKILVGGDFKGTDSIGGATRNYLARLDATSGLADSFDPNANSSVYSIALQADGKILAGGSFNSIGGAARNYIARLELTGAADSFNPDANHIVNAIALQADGKILVGGQFRGANSIGGQTRSLFARLNNDTVARQNLAVSKTSVTWTRGGSSAQFTRVTFEDSTDGVNYNFLGNGTVVGSNWTLTGLNLSIGQNFYIRARGYYRGGRQSTSESIQESVRNVFLLPATPQPLLKIQRSANTNVMLSWATNFIGFTLEASANLNTNVWSVVSPAPIASGANNVVTNTVGGSTRFYRLRK